MEILLKMCTIVPMGIIMGTIDHKTKESDEVTAKWNKRGMCLVNTICLHWVLHL